MSEELKTIRSKYLTIPVNPEQDTKRLLFKNNN